MRARTFSLFIPVCMLVLMWHCFDGEPPSVPGATPSGYDWERAQSLQEPAAQILKDAFCQQARAQGTWVLTDTRWEFRGCVDPYGDDPFLASRTYGYDYTNSFSDAPGYGDVPLDACIVSSLDTYALPERACHWTAGLQTWKSAA